MAEEKSKITSGILSGFEVNEEQAKVVGELADNIEELHNGKINPEEKTLAQLFGAEDKPQDAKAVADIVDANSGSKVAEHGVLTGAGVDAAKAEELKDVAETLGNDAGIKDTLAVAMGVESKSK